MKTEDGRKDEMKFVYSDGGRSNYFRGTAGDCVCRAIANASGRDYKEVYKGLSALMKSKKRGGSCRDGVDGDIARTFIIKELGWKWHPTMGIGTGCRMHMREEELPKGTLIVSLSKHYTCVKDGTVYDTYDCTRDGGRCVYGYYTEH